MSLFSKPFDLKDPRAKELLRLCCTGDDRKDRIKLLVSEIGIPDTDIDWDGSLTDVWLRILTLAARRARLRKLVQALLDDENYKVVHPQIEALLGEPKAAERDEASSKDEGVKLPDLDISPSPGGGQINGAVAAVTQVEQVAVKPSTPGSSPSKDAPTSSRPPGAGRAKRRRSEIIAWVTAAICFIIAVVAVIFAINAQGNVIYEPATSGTYDSTPSGTTLWTYTTQGAVESSPVVADSTVYVGSDDDQVYALAATSGNVRWSDPTGDKVTSRPAVAGGTVYVGSNDHKVYALDAATGHLHWTYTTGAAITSDLAVAGSTVYVGSNDHKLYALDATTGQVRWTHTTGDYVGSPAIAGDTVYVGSDDHKVYALNATTGDIRWTHTTGGAVTAGLAVAGSTVYVGSDQLYALDAATGRVRWTYATGTIESTPAVAGGIVYIGSLDDKVYAIDAATGHVRWTHTTGDVILSDPAVAGGTVYICSNDQSLYALNAATGHEIWTSPVGQNGGQNMVSGPAVANGVVYVGSNSNEVNAFQAGA